MRRLAFLLALLLTSGVRASSCGPSAFEGAVKRADLVAEVQVVRYVGKKYGLPPRWAEMEVRVLKTFRGQARSSALRIRGDDGAAPFPQVSQYPVGTRWVVALIRRDWQTGQPLPGNLYTPVVCSGQGLLVSGPIAYGTLSAKGRHVGSASSIRLTSLPAWIKFILSQP